MVEAFARVYNLENPADYQDLAYKIRQIIQGSSDVFVLAGATPESLLFTADAMYALSRLEQEVNFHRPPQTKVDFDVVRDAGVIHLYATNALPENR